MTFISCSIEIDKDVQPDFPPALLSKTGVSKISQYTCGKTDTAWLLTSVFEVDKRGLIVRTFRRAYGDNNEMQLNSEIVYANDGRKRSSYSYLARQRYEFNYVDAGRNYTMTVRDSAGNETQHDEVTFEKGYKSVVHYDAKGKVRDKEKFAQKDGVFPLEDESCSKIEWVMNEQNKPLRIARYHRNGDLQLIHVYYFGELQMARVSGRLNSSTITITKFVYR